GGVVQDDRNEPKRHRLNERGFGRTVVMGLQWIEKDICVRKRGRRLRRLPTKYHPRGVPHRLRPGSHRTRRIDRSPYQNANIVISQPVNCVEKSGMHFRKIGGSEIGDGGLAVTCRHSSPAALKTEAAVDYRDPALGGLRQLRHRGDITGRFRREDKAHGRFHQPGWNKRGVETGNMRPEHAAHRGEWTARKTFEQARVIPKLELDNVGVACQMRDVFEIVHDDDTRAAIFDRIHVAAIAGLFKQHESLLDFSRQDAAKRRMSLADAAAEMRRDMQNLHSAATTEKTRLTPPGGSTFGSTGTTCLNFSSNATRCASILSGKQWLSWPQLPQTPFCRRRPSRCCRRSAFIRLEVQISFIDCCRTSPITSLRPQSRKHELTSPSAFTE